MPSQPIERLAEIADRYDAFILDQWGVLHNGTAPLPGVLGTLEGLHALKKRVVLLSNSGRRRSHNVDRLADMGFASALFHDVVTSGEVNYRLLKSGRLGDVDLPGRRCFLVCRDNDTSVIDGTGVERAHDPAAADFVAITGIHGETRTVESYVAELEGAIAHKLPVLCSNPDFVAVSPVGIVPAPGAVARAYGELAGVAPVFVGKPHSPVYNACFEALAGVAKDRIVAVGDSLDHDVRGGNAAGIDTVFLTDGIEIDAFHPEIPLTDQLQALRGLIAVDERVAPTYIMRRLAWN